MKLFHILNNNEIGKIYELVWKYEKAFSYWYKT